MFIHILFIEQCNNRLLVLTQWLRSYFTGARSARLIEGASSPATSLLGPNGDDGAHFTSAPSEGRRLEWAGRDRSESHQIQTGARWSDGLLWHRIQFAFSITFHYLFPQLTMGLALLIVAFKSACHLRFAD